MTLAIIIIISFLYLVLLFIIANTVESRYARFARWINSPYTYTLSLAIYCSAWTFYGSVGGASQKGVGFLAIYIGPTIAAFLFIPILQKIIKIKNNTGFSSFADFLSLRFGRSIWLGAFITILCIISVVPYIALQIKSLTDIIVFVENSNQPSESHFNQSISLYIALALSFFIMVYGFRTIDAGEKRSGMIGAIAFESIIKLISFIVLGIAIVMLGYNHIGSPMLSESNAHLKNYESFWKFPSQVDWVANIFLSFLAFLFLPRQFQVAVVENKNEKHLAKASWLFPLYLLLINLFVLPIALYGNAILAGKPIHPDNFVIALPMFFHKPVLVAIAYLGGFSAATSMIIVETIALNIMLSNNIILPSVIWFRQKFGILQGNSLDYLILNIRRAGVLLIIIMAFYYETTLDSRSSLINIGLTSFVAISQFAPIVFAALYWKQVNLKAAYTSLMVGFSLWFYFLILPYFEEIHLLPTHISTAGLWGYEFLNPKAFLGFSDFSPTTTAFFWSMFFNSLSVVVVSVFTKATKQEEIQGKIYTESLHNEIFESNEINSKTKVKDLIEIMEHFIGKERLDSIIRSYKRNQPINLEAEFAPSKFVQYCQRILSGVLGIASARLLFKSFHRISDYENADEIIQVLTEKQNIKMMNRELIRNQEALKKATSLLKDANEKMKKIDSAKDEFLHTITHELRTPLTSIRALSEIVLENPDLESQERQNFIQVIVKESERLTHLINQVLRLEKIESEMYQPNFEPLDLAEIVEEVINAQSLIIAQQKAEISFQKPPKANMLLADKDLIQQVIQNILGNALKHRSGDSCKINIEIQEQYEEIVCLISDNGPGIDDKIGEAIFDKYRQAQKRQLNKPEGSGLGLAICKKILELHHGKIGYKNNPHQGLTFYFSIPKQTGEL